MGKATMDIVLFYPRETGREALAYYWYGGKPVIEN